MIWTPPERSAAARAINAGEIGLLAEESEAPLERDALVVEALSRQGLPCRSPSDLDRALGCAGFEAAPALENLAAFLDALAREASLHAIGRILTRRFLLRLLSVRSQIIRVLREDPGVQDEEIRAPWIVAGAPRTGTTILHALLAADPAHRVPEGWELLYPVPSPPPGRLVPGQAEDPFEGDPRIALAEQELVRPQRLVEALLKIHEYGSRKPKECLSAMSFAFASEEFTARYHVPSFAARLADSDLSDAYRMHRLVLRIRQRAQPDTAWVLKSPVHLHALPTLFATYPDARVAITHRDPITLLSSLTSLIANLRYAHSDAVDPTAIASAHVERYTRSFDALVHWTEAGTLPPDQIHHSHFGDFQDAPLETTDALYDTFGRALSPEARAAMQATLATNGGSTSSAHRYDRGALGEDPTALRARFARYQATFRVPSDPDDADQRPA